MTKLYVVCLTRDITESAVVEVEANTEDEAREKAMDLAGDVTFHADEPCEGVYVSWMKEEPDEN